MDFGWMVRFLPIIIGSSGFLGVCGSVKSPPKTTLRCLISSSRVRPSDVEVQVVEVSAVGPLFFLSKCPRTHARFGGTKCQVKVLRWNGFLLPSLLNFKAPGLSETWMNCCNCMQSEGLFLRWSFKKTQWPMAQSFNLTIGGGFKYFFDFHHDP